VFSVCPKVKKERLSYFWGDIRL